MNSKPEWTTALLEASEVAIKSDADWFERFFGRALPESSREFDYKLNTAVIVVALLIVNGARNNIKKSISETVLNTLPNGFHIIVMYGLCIVMCISILCGKEGHSIDAHACGLSFVGALLFMRSSEEKREQYQLAHVLLGKFAGGGVKFTSWLNDLTQLTQAYVMPSTSNVLNEYDYPSLFGSMLKTLISAVGVPE